MQGIHRFCALVTGFACLVAAPQAWARFYDAAWHPNQSLPDAPLEKAAFAFPVQNIRQQGNTVSFIIPHDAHDFQKKADAVVLSGLYAIDRPIMETCPVVDSHYVDKKVRDYNPFTGKAEVVAVFDRPVDAARAAQSGCLLIHDVD